MQQAWSVARAVTGHRVHVVKNKVACSNCHDLSGNDIGRVDVRRCGACHEQESRLEHAGHAAAQRFGPGARADCTTCHAFTLEGSGHEAALKQLSAPRGGGGSGALGPELKPFSPEDCERCHKNAQGKVPAVVVHGTQACSTCHRPHEDDEPKSAPCEGCHAQVHTTHAATGKSPTEVCQTCHQHQHASSLDARATCQDCHRSHEPLVPASALFEGGHTECVGCHRPHGFEKRQAAECRGCHEHQTSLGGGKISAHVACTNCHSPHAVQTSPQSACQRCHQAVHPDHPQRGVVGTCVGCHDPHPDGGHAGLSAKSCSSCHQFAASDHASHAGVGCVKCHEPHQFVQKLGATQACQGCHASQIQHASTNPGHRACQGCHGGLPHRPEALLAGCSTCHQQEHAKVSTGHAQCTSCHEPHSGAQGKACGACHAAEQRSAPTGHQTCGDCHEPHSGSHAAKACHTCHQKEGSTAHGKVGQGCQTCHRPHGPNGVASPPACSTCHQPAKLPGLHAEPKHAPCARCHGGHGDQPGLLRDVCLSCHQDRKTHFPDAPRCANCHLFTEGQ